MRRPPIFRVVAAARQRAANFLIQSDTAERVLSSQSEPVGAELRAYALQFGLKPGALFIAMDTGRPCELVSWPWWQSGQLVVNARRTVDDPTSMEMIPVSLLTPLDV